MAAVISGVDEGRGAGFWEVVSSPQAVAALKLSFGASFVIALVNAVVGTVIAWCWSATIRGKSP